MNMLTIGFRQGYLRKEAGDELRDPAKPSQAWSESARPAASPAAPGLRADSTSGSLNLQDRERVNPSPKPGETLSPYTPGNEPLPQTPLSMEPAGDPALIHDNAAHTRAGDKRRVANADGSAGEVGIKVGSTGGTDAALKEWSRINAGRMSPAAMDASRKNIRQQVLNGKLKLADVPKWTDRNNQPAAPSANPPLNLPAAPSAGWQVASAPRN